MPRSTRGPGRTPSEVADKLKATGLRDMIPAGVLPPPEILKELETLQPGVTDRLLTLMELEMRLVWRRQTFMFVEVIVAKVLGLVGLGLVILPGYMLGMNDKTEAAVAVFCVTAVAVIAGYVGKLSMRWDRADEGQTQPND